MRARPGVPTPRQESSGSQMCGHPGAPKPWGAAGTWGRRGRDGFQPPDPRPCWGQASWGPSLHSAVKRPSSGQAWNIPDPPERQKASVSAGQAHWALLGEASMLGPVLAITTIARWSGESGCRESATLGLTGQFPQLRADRGQGHPMPTLACSLPTRGQAGRGDRGPLTLLPHSAGGAWGLPQFPSHCPGASCQLQGRQGQTWHRTGWCSRGSRPHAPGHPDPGTEASRGHP